MGVCVLYDPKQHRTRLNARAEPCVFLGYPPNQKVYKVLNLTTKQIQVYRDVIFNEKNFPFHMSTDPNTPSSPTFQFFLPKSTIIPSFQDFDIPDIFKPLTTNILKTPLNTPDQPSPTYSSIPETDSEPHLTENTEHQSPTSPAPPLRKSTRIL